MATTQRALGRYPPLTNAHHPYHNPPFPRRNRRGNFIHTVMEGFEVRPAQAFLPRIPPFADGCQPTAKSTVCQNNFGKTQKDGRGGPGVTSAVTQQGNLLPEK